MSTGSRAVPRPACTDVYLLDICDEYTDPQLPRPVNAVVVHARTLLHRDVPQPDGGMMYRCLTEFPGRTPGCVVPVSTLTFELGNGTLWHQVADWDAVTCAVVCLARARRCDALSMDMPFPQRASLANGPYTVNYMYGPRGEEPPLGPADRRRFLAEVTARVRAAAASEPFRPGEHLVDPPSRPSVLPYRPSPPAGPDPRFKSGLGQPSAWARGVLDLGRDDT